MAEGQTYHALSERRTAAFALVAASLGLVVGGWWWWRPFRAAVDGDSMEPALRAGDWLVATRWGRVRVGSIVVMAHPARPGFELVKRVTALPGDRVDGRVIDRGHLWVVGDAADRSTDSRTFGPVPRTAMRGVVRFRYGRAERHG